MTLSDRGYREIVGRPEGRQAHHGEHRRANADCSRRQSLGALRKFTIYVIEV